MNAELFCGEHGKELQSGRITFSKKDVDRFIKTYTYLEPSDFTEQMRERLKSFVMIPFYNTAISKHYHDPDSQKAEKIELPNIIFQ